MTEQRSPEPSSETPETHDKRTPLRRRVSNAWNRLEPATKAELITAAAVAVVGGAIFGVRARAHAAATEEGEAEDPMVSRIFTDSPPRTPYVGKVNGYRRNQCLNPRGHAAGSCSHENRWVPDYIKGAAADV
ncbi:hypothetical protein [Streptomyces sp. AD55]|uniref:hypothetical protein n=1 Tax=Streptomyces sp. AD55 TaxID=3242895 RepID=UPI0035287CE5